MRFLSWHVDGFGVFADFEQSRLPDGLVVFHGENEAGKSTLLAFIRGVLFGYRDGRFKEGVYPPLNGGAHGGRIVIEHDGNQYTVGRHSGKNRVAQITDSNGEELGEDVLRQILGGADRALFNNVFAIGLREVQELESLEKDGVRDRIFSAAVAGSGRSAREAAKNLHARAKKIFNSDPRSKSDEVSMLLEKLRGVESSLAEARNASRGYESARHLEATKKHELTGLNSGIEILREESALIARLQGLWPRWCERATAINTLADGDPDLRMNQHIPVPKDEELKQVFWDAGKVDELLAAQRAAQMRRPDAAAAVGEADRRLNDRLKELGSDWTRSSLELFTFALPQKKQIRDWQEEIDANLRTQQAASAAQKNTEEIRKICKTNLNNEDTALADLGDPPLEISALRDRTAELESLRAKLSELADTRRDLEAKNALLKDQKEKLQEAEDRSISMWRWTGPPLILFGLAGMITAFFGFNNRWLAMASFVAVVGMAIGAAQYRQYANHRKKAQDRIVLLRDEVENLEAAVAVALDETNRQASVVSEIAKAQELTDPVTHSGIEAARKKTDTQIDLRNEWDLRKHSRDAANDALTVALTAETTAENQLSEILDEISAQNTRWISWREAHRFPESLSPGSVDDFAAAIELARESLDDRDARDAELQSFDAEHINWAADACAVLEKRGVSEIPESGADLLDLFKNNFENFQMEMSARNKAAEVEEEIRAQAPNDPDEANALFTALDSGNPDQWSARIEEIREAIENQQAERDEIFEEAIKARKFWEGLELGALSADLEMQKGELIEQVTQKQDEWRKLTLAAALIEQTLSQFEKEHQPAVLSKAGQIFSQVTNGRYKSVLQGADGDGFVVINERGDRLDPSTQLSRGTREQLYLCLRIGLAESFSQHGANLPILLDDTLVNFDAERLAKFAEALADMAKSRQVILFTCHSHVVDILKTVVSDIAIFDLPIRPLI